MQRRHLLLIGTAALAGCGFQLRREPELPFQSLALTGFPPDSPLALGLKRQIKRTPVQLQEDPARAQVVLEALHEFRDRTVVASTSVGQVREWQLRLHFDYLVRRPDGDLLVPKVELRLYRDMNYTETAALAKEQEAANLYSAMHSDAIAQVMRRLAAVKV
ncbi:LPS assembly lipoprotein LptE [Roseateles asaccharophilus]|uniref:LPS-assembly lipoprotein LptE n=1 Tax=Roseateles asaccharophilus TaxID=582607 RepID=A0ABU2AD05_9BURK|nr:LPS assembly lipoprotein LptE [Roseateles asaccharophilus]MDR7335079.1 LPS-assembly lipoprotein [Roseateles asaccharophilus]